VIALVAAALAQDVSIAESLATSSSATTVYGGTFTGAGWRVDDASSRLFWDFGAQVERGDVSVTVSDVALEDVTLANNHLIELFSEGGHWGDNRAINLRVYGRGTEAEPASDWGQIKLVVWDRATDLFAEERYAGVDWDGLPHVWRITWDTSWCVLYRDGAELIRLDVAGIDLRVGTLWLPLNDWTGDYSAPIGALYSDLRLDGWLPADDTDPVPPDDGDASTLLPADDVTAASWEDGVFPDDEALVIEDGAAVAYLAYDLSAVSGTVTRATLTLRATSSGSADGDGGTVYAVGDASWSEDALTWATRPAMGAALGGFGAVSPDGTYTVDVTGGVRAGGRVAFAIASDGANSTEFSSKEAGAGDRAAVLTLAVEEGDADTDTDTDTDADADTGAIDDWEPRAPREHASAEDDDGGCGCDAGGTSAGWLAVAAAFAMRRRR
jgi:hypothetical protein